LDADKATFVQVAEAGSVVSESATDVAADSVQQPSAGCLPTWIYSSIPTFEEISRSDDSF
jgi:hypothetical protein